MMPFEPMHENIDRVIKNLEHGLPEESAPAAEGGLGADTPELDEAKQDLKQEGALDEEEAEEASDK